MDLLSLKNRDELHSSEGIPLPFAKARIMYNEEGVPVDLVIEDVNTLFEKILGIDKKQIIAKGLTSICADFESKLRNAFVPKSLNKENPVNFNFEVCLFSNNQCFDVFVTQISKSKANLIFQDSSARVMEMGGIPSDAKRFKQLYDTLNVGVYRVSPEGKFLMVNSTLLNLLGYRSDEEILGKNINNERQALNLPGNLQQSMEAEGMLFGIESSWQTKSGDAILTKENIRSIKDIHGSLLFYQGMIENISTLKIEESQVKQLNDIFLELGIEPSKNMQLIVRKSCEIINGFCSVYLCFDESEDKLVPVAEFNVPENFLENKIQKGNICFDAVINKKNGPGVFDDLSKTDYYKHDPELEMYGFQAFMGHPVHFNGSVNGSLCVFDVRTRRFTETELNIIGTLAIALTLEHKRFILENDLKKASLDAKNANRAKSQFLANMSHEIRTPLNGIMGFSELLLSQETDDKKKRMLRMVEESGQQLFRIISDIFDYSMIETGKINLKESIFNVQTTLQETVHYFTGIAGRKGLELVFNMDGIEHVELQGDIVKFNQVLVNIISNAIKFTDEGSVIVLAKTEAAGDLVNLAITVEDSGIGIDKEQLENIFVEFEQLEYYLTKRIRGTGIGLAITKKLVDFLNGTILVESEPGKGSRFKITIPFKPKTIQNSEPRMENTKEKNMKPDSGINILLAEDNEANQFLIKAITKSQDWNITVVDDGEKAVKAFKEADYHIVLMDVQMPTMNGYEATKEIRKYEEENGKHTPIIALTAYAMQSDKDLCIEAGMDDYISKPFKRQEFLNAITSALEKYST